MAVVTHPQCVLGALYDVLCVSPVKQCGSMSRGLGTKPSLSCPIAGRSQEAGLGAHAPLLSSLFPWASGLTCLLCYTFQAQRDIIFELRRIAFDAESDPSNVPGSGTEKRKAMYTKDYKMLGFTVSTQGAPF